MAKTLSSVVPAVSATRNELAYVEAKVITLKDHPHYNEFWLQDRIQENPSILGLGNIELRDRERRQSKAGRLDFLFSDVEARRRYEVEIQLGALDESHIIRTIEYWDNERKRFPQYDHCAVIIAEEITTRFLNVIGLFNGHIPLIAIQVKAVQVDDKISLFFTKVLNEIELGLEDEDESASLAKTRADWEKETSIEAISLVDSMLASISSFGPGLQLTYKRGYIAPSHGGRTQGFVVFKPQRKGLRMDIRLKLSSEHVKELEDSGVEVLDYVPNWRVHPVRVLAASAKNPPEALMRILKQAYDDYNS